MKQIQPHSLPVFTIALALALTLLSRPSACAEEGSAKVNLEQAKAELAKAKAEKAKSGAGAEAKTEPVAELKIEEPESEDKTPRKRRLFGRSKKETEQPVEIVRPEEVEAEQAEPKKEVTKERPSGLRRFSPFSRAKSKDEDESEVDAADAPVENPEIAKVEPEKEAEDRKRRRLFGGLFARDSSQPDPKSEIEKPVPAKSEENKLANTKGALFSMFRRSDSKESAKADKTKLGKSIESKPSQPSSGALTKKSANTGELGWYVVTEAATPFYAIGPGQPMPPEKVLDRGSMLTVTKGGWGWCNVRLGSGELGVISTKAMRPATVAEVSRHSRSGSTASRSRGSRSLFNILSRGPAPTLDLPTSSGIGPIRNFGLLPPIDSSE